VTANYGFFAHLAIVLHVFLLDADDVARVAIALRRRFAFGRAQLLDWHERSTSATVPPEPPLWPRAGLAGAFVLYVAISTLESFWHFTPLEPPAPLAALRSWYAPLRVVNTYHLFGHITRERIEPEIQIETEHGWRAYHLRYKPGDPAASLPLVAPHQPRVDFQLWFHGLSFQRRPAYLQALLERLCRDPEAVADLFVEAPPAGARAVRVEYWRYHFTTPEERAASGAVWKRESVAALRPWRCQ
jgi:lipase maturation factor 1